MSLETDIQTAYEEQEAVETAARELEARIRRIDGAARLMPPRSLLHAEKSTRPLTPEHSGC